MIQTEIGFEVEVEYCDHCHRIRRTDEHGVWQPWVDARRVGQAIIKRAEKRLCDMCMKHE